MRCVTNNNPCRTGFTLVELLTVIAILALLAAILLPTLLSARKKSHQTMCLSNMRQVGVALQLYVDDNDGSYPDSDVLPMLFNKERGFAGCPDVQQSKEKDGQQIPGYSFNLMLIGMYPIIPPRIQGAVLHPTMTVALAETKSSDFVTNWLLPENRGRRHNEGGNFLFCDSHVKWHQPEAVRSMEESNDGTRPAFSVEQW